MKDDNIVKTAAQIAPSARAHLEFTLANHMVMKTNSMPAAEATKISDNFWNAHKINLKVVTD